MSPARRGVTALLAACSLTLGGCGGPSSDGAESTPESAAATESAPAPADGTVIEGNGFTFTAPQGWKQDDGSSVPSMNFLAVAVDASASGEFASNINVIEDPTIVDVDPDELADSVTTLLGGMASEVELVEPVEVDGEPALVVTALYTNEAFAYRTRQLAVVHEGTGYVVTYSFGEDVDEAEQRAITESVNDTWDWTP